jgi:2-amino-4-hydroxy-6-hydroxymethyldihydropteridine diphosphokinase
MVWVNLMTIIAALGANILSQVGEPKDTITHAISLIRGAGIDVIDISNFYITKPVPVSGQPDFVNCAITLASSKNAKHLLAVFHEIESQLGRARDERWGARTIDIDLIAFGQAVLPNEKLWYELANHRDPSVFINDPMIPHPRMHKRAFVLVPVLDVAPNWIHPLYQKTARDLLIDIEDQEISKIDENK